MPQQHREVTLDPKTGRLTDPKEGAVSIPEGWELLPPGDPGLTRRVKSAGPCWSVIEPKRGKIFRRGVLAPAETIARIRAELEQERADPAYARKRASAAASRERKQQAYVEDFRGAILAFLDFPDEYRELAERMAELVAAHATPVGSGTVARTERIPIEGRAAAAVIAWMRHQTTDYDDLRIVRARGARREVRRELAVASHRLLDRYRRGRPIDDDCPLHQALTTGRRRSEAIEDDDLDEDERYLES
ncbi:MAG TPA: DUF2293 domain-containing protein [Planctomycetaceae bacterium]|nr:DUF2293 domain-containing protein [Planctomycetaceae bacterium]HRF01360.1 DUF2293 domain-containing protein [Pirellulaceae bacterium]